MYILKIYYAQSSNPRLEHKKKNDTQREKNVKLSKPIQKRRKKYCNFSSYDVHLLKGLFRKHL